VDPGVSPEKLNYFLKIKYILLTNEHKKQSRMANVIGFEINATPFIMKMNEIATTRYGNINLRINAIKELYTMMLSPDGRLLLTRDDNFRAVAKERTTEMMNNPLVEPYIQFMALSRLLLTVIENITIGKN
jgi:hypothetical protein